MAEIIPLLATAAQTLTVRLGDQPCAIDVYQKTSGMFVDLYVNGALIVGGVAARNGVRMVRDTYLGFIGDIAFVDTQGTDDPQAAGLGTRWVLSYLPVGE